jgi:hypothetical protein
VVKLRWALAIAVVLMTTFGGLSTRRAVAAGPPVSKRAIRAAVINPAETVFEFGDLLDAVNYEVGFEPDARDGARLTAACRALFADQPKFQAALQKEAKAKDIANDLVAAAEPTVELCFDPLSADDNAEAHAAVGFADFHEKAFDFADAVR